MTFGCLSGCLRHGWRSFGFLVDVEIWWLMGIADAGSSLALLQGVFVTLAWGSEVLLMLGPQNS
jgi:hypothetical protein